MSLSVAGIGAVQPVYTPSGPAVPYAQNPETTASVAGTTAGSEAGATAVVYEPGSAEESAQYTYANPDKATRTLRPSGAPVSPGDSAVVEATNGIAQPVPALPETPRLAEVKHLLNDVWAPVGPINVDPAAANVGATVAPVPVGQAEASAQASYAAIADASIAGAPLSDLEKFA